MYMNQTAIHKSSIVDSIYGNNAFNLQSVFFKI
jgi:hypothetical protein